jgi:alcohol dehydrogenase YqhD (iron-dependent ADH family)
VRASPEYDDLVSSLPQLRSFEPDFLLAIGGGSTIDSAKFLSWAINLWHRKDPSKCIRLGTYPSRTIPVVTVVTLPASGSWWNPIFSLKRRAKRQQLAGEYVYPTVSFLDPRYSLSLPVRQLRNSVCDALVHCIDQFATGDECPLFDGFWLVVMREIVRIGPAIVAGPPSLELHERLLMAASFALNYALELGKPACWGIHFVASQISVAFEIDHAIGVVLVAPVLLELRLKTRKVTLAKAAEFVFGIDHGAQDEKAQQFIERLRAFFEQVGAPRKLSEIEGVDLSKVPLKVIVRMVMQHMCRGSFGWNGEITKGVVKKIMMAVLV